MFDLRTFALLMSNFYPTEFDPELFSLADKHMIIAARNEASTAMVRQKACGDLPYVPTVLPDDRFKAAFGRLCAIMEGGAVQPERGLVR